MPAVGEKLPVTDSKQTNQHESPADIGGDAYVSEGQTCVKDIQYMKYECYILFDGLIIFPKEETMQIITLCTVVRSSFPTNNPPRAYNVPACHSASQ